MKLTIKVDEKSSTIDIYGGDSGCTRRDPYWIPFERVWEPWISHMSGKNWMTHQDLRDLEMALNRRRVITPTNVIPD